MNDRVLEYYATHSRLTEPGEYQRLLETLPTDPVELDAAINGILIHIWKVRKYQPQLLAERPHEVFIRHIERLLEGVVALDSRPLNIERPQEKRMIIDCRHFATFLCATLRQRGVPARARCGFATYLEETHDQDHWVCEHWVAEEQRWVMDDPDLQMHDVPPEQFITGARAWQMCREDSGRGDRFGFDPNMRGMWTTRVNLVRDFAALNGFESVSGDGWGLAMKEDKDLTPDDIALLDQAAALAATDDQFEQRRSLYETSSLLRVPDMIHNYDYVVANAWRTVDWQQEL